MSRCLRPVRNRLPSLSCLALACVTLLACAGEPTGTPPPPPPPPFDPAVGVELSPTRLSLLVGAVSGFTARAYDAAGRTVPSVFEWSSVDPAIATVGKNDGVVTAISAGTTTVTATVGTLSATAPVSVAAIVGTIAFTRLTGSLHGDGSFTSDVLSYSFPDRAPQSLPRPAQFPSIAAPAWSPDGTLLAVEVIHTTSGWGSEDGSDYTSDVYVLRAAAPGDSPWRALTANGRSRSPSWSPDGGRIAYVGPSMLASGNQIYVVDAGGGEPVLLTRTEGFYAAPRWSPDGTRVAFSALSDGLVGNWEVFTVNADGSGLTNVTRNSAFDFDPSWSPDGSRLAFISDRDGGLDGSYRRDVFVVDVDGNSPRSLTRDLFGPGSWSNTPVWSPDSQQIVFSLGGPEHRSGIYVMNADGYGSWLIQLTTPPLDSWDNASVWRR